MREKIKFYPTLTTALNNKNRTVTTKQIVAVLSIQGMAYYPFYSEPGASGAMLRIARTKLDISCELKEKQADIEELNKTMTAEQREKKREDEQNRILTMVEHMKSDGIEKLFPQNAIHAEEKLILQFKNAITDFKKRFPTQKAKTINIFLTHSPCIKNGEKNCSVSFEENGFFHAQSCEKKIINYFQLKNLRKLGYSLFSEGVKTKVYYNAKFDPQTKSHNLIKEADPLLKTILHKAK